MTDIIDKLDPEDKSEGAYNPSDKERAVGEYLLKRVEVLKETKKNILNGVNFLEIMRAADEEYAPKLYTQKKTSGAYFVQDEINGIRGSRLVRGVSDDDDWQSNVSEPTLLVKIQTALSILVNQNPEATFKATLEKYKASSALAKAIWKRSWELQGSKENLSLFIFDLAKYGWAIGRTYPRIIKRDKQVLESLDLANPEKNVYRKDTIIEFNDIFRKRLDPYRTWIDDQTNLSDPFSMQDWYYEEDYSREVFEQEFGNYANSKFVKFGNASSASKDGVENNNDVQRDDMVTVGFYESKKDLYVIYIPEQNIVLFQSPLPNDDGKLSCWWSYWTVRDPRTPYGIGLYEIIKNDKILYDRIRNMTVDQLVMAIYPMLFYSGTPGQGDGNLKISPRTVMQKLPGTSIDQVKIQYDQRGWEGVQKQKEAMDETTGITPTLQGQVEGKTLGEVLHAKDSALKRLNIPLNNIATALQAEAFITLSWAKQVYSVPEIETFIDVQSMQKHIDKSGMPDQAMVNGDNKIEASYYRKLDLGLEEDREGTLIEAPEDRFLSAFGMDFDWEGRIVVKAHSIVSLSPELERQRKLEVFNLVGPMVQTMSMLFYQQVDPKTGQAFTPEGGKEVAIAIYKPLKQILEIQDEEPANWIPKDILAVAENPEILKQQAMQKKEAEQMSQELFVDQNAQQAPSPQSPQSPQAPTAPTIAPMNEVSNPLRASLGQIDRVR